MMEYKEISGNIFEMPEEYKLVQCISADCALGAGVALEFEKRFEIRDRLKEKKPHIGNAILVDRTFNLVTKRRCWNKPTYDTIRTALESLRFIVKYRKIRKVAMVKIGCGLDRLTWSKVKRIILDVFKDVDVKIIVIKKVKKQKV